jgi:hypothetical protein
LTVSTPSAYATSLLRVPSATRSLLRQDAAVVPHGLSACVLCRRKRLARLVMATVRRPQHLYTSDRRNVAQLRMSGWAERTYTFSIREKVTAVPRRLLADEVGSIIIDFTGHAFLTGAAGKCDAYLSHRRDTHVVSRTLSGAHRLSRYVLPSLPASSYPSGRTSGAKS